MGTCASIAAALHVAYHIRESLPPGSLVIIVPLLLSLILSRRRHSKEHSSPPSPMASCTFVTPFRQHSWRERSRTGEEAATNLPGLATTLEPGLRRPPLPEPDMEFPFLVGQSDEESTVSLLTSVKANTQETSKTQRCSLHKYDRHRPRRNKKDQPRTVSSESYGPTGSQEEHQSPSAPLLEGSTSCDRVKDSVLPSADAGGNGVLQLPARGGSTSRESIEVARNSHNFDDDDDALTTDLSWKSFDVCDDSHRSGDPYSVPWDYKSIYPKLTSALSLEQDAVAKSDQQAGSSLVFRECCTTVAAEPDLEVLTGGIGARLFGELLQLCGQEKAATFRDVLRELDVQKCLKLQEREGEEVFRVDTDRGKETVLLTVLHGDYVTRHWNRILDGIAARTESYYCVRDKYSEILNKACIDYFNLKGCTKFGEDERRMIRSYIIVVETMAS